MSTNINKLTINNFNKICRTCCREGDLISLYENTYLIEMLSSCAQIKFEINDCLPKHICLTCVEELNQCYTFTFKCKMVDTALRKCTAEQEQEIDVKTNEVFIKIENSDDTSYEPNEHFCNNNLSDPDETNLDSGVVSSPSNQTEPLKIPQKCEDKPSSKNARKFTCDICNKVMNNLSNLRRHEQIHSGEKKYLCTVCNKSFRHSGTLITHQRSHSGERPCVCDICGKTYIDLSTLGRHKKIHLGEKRFVCDVCNKRFTQSGDLNVHKRLHSEKPFVCDVCLKRFNKMSHLRKHKKVHFKNIDVSSLLSACDDKPSDKSV